MSDFEDTVADAEFVLRGTVEKVNASTVATLAADKATVVFHVDEVLHSPAAFAGLEGQDVTVRTLKANSLAQGEKTILSARGLMYAENLALSEIGHHPVRGAQAPTSARVAKVKAARSDATMGDRVKRATVIVSGRVADVRVPQHALLVADVAPGGNVGPVSEHDPYWREAVISVDSTLKGDPQQEAVVRFAASNDIAWADTPKLKAGQEGVFLLHQEDDLPKLETAVAAAVPTALSPLDVRPLEDEKAIQLLVRGAK